MLRHATRFIRLGPFGVRQREPRLLLFDEPLATLDATRKDEILPYLEQLHDVLNVPSLYVRLVRCRIEASDVSLTLQRQTDTSILNLTPVTITPVTDTLHPGQSLVQLDANGTALVAHVAQRSWEALQLTLGKSVWAQVKAVALIG